jgi:16S rRNA (uracil1498-N3)-methyltransferase
MSHPRRFFVNELKSQSFKIGGEEFIHAKKVLRLKVGDEVTLIDGKGREVKGKVNAIEPQSFFVEAIAPILTHELPQIRANIIVGLSEPQSLEEALLHSTELGVFRFCITEMEHSNIKFEQIIKRKERLEKIAISGIKQSHNPFLPQILFYKNLEAALNDKTQCGFFFSQNAEKPFCKIDKPQGDVLLVIGPEGDFSEEERELLIHKAFLNVKLCDNVLRVETAVISALSQLKIFDYQN